MLGSETVVLTGEVRRDSDNNPTPGSGSLTVDGCLVETMSVSETAESDRDSRVTVIRVFLPITDGVDGRTAVTVRGRTYRVDADPEPYIDDDDPELSGYVLTARRAKG